MVSERSCIAKGFWMKSAAPESRIAIYIDKHGLALTDIRDERFDYIIKVVLSITEVRDGIYCWFFR